MPSTRYLGSKRKLLPALSAVFSKLEFEVAADPFCGSGAVSYLLKTLGKEVFAADALLCNTIGTRALLCNAPLQLETRLQEAFEKMKASTEPPGFIETHFEKIFFTTEENRFIDRFVQQIQPWRPELKDAARFALFQAALAKRPYNLFHRANLYMRTQKVKRSFGNKATWDTPFETHILRNAKELQTARFDSGKKMTVVQQRVEDAAFLHADLVYLDPPYVSRKGMGVDYLDYYHLLEGIGLEDNAAWEKKLLTRYKHKPLLGRGQNPWCDATTILDSFSAVFDKCTHAKMVISYRSDGVPSIEELIALLKHHGRNVAVVDCGRYVYALSKNKKSKEIILVADD